MPEGKAKVSVGLGALQRDRPRRCTDVLFLLLFLGSLGATGYAALWGMENGNLDRVVYGQDYIADLVRQG